MPCVLTVHHGGRADVLLDTLVELLAAPPDDPFTTEVVSVPSRGIERWLQQQLSRQLGTTSSTTATAGGPPSHDGITANVDFPFPDRLVRRALGDDAAADPWDVGPLTWHVLASLRVTDPVATYVRARQIADLFDRYAVYRPGLLHQWRAGYDHGPDGRTARRAPRLASALVAATRRSARSRSRPAPADIGRRPPRRRTRRRLAGARGGAGVRHAPGVADQRARRAQCPPRCARPAPPPVTVLVAVGRGTGCIADPRAAPSTDRGELVASPAHHVGAGGAREPSGATRRRRRQPDGVPSTTSASIRRRSRCSIGSTATSAAAVDPAASPPLRWTPADRSFQVHAAHGRTRQVEVLRDALAHLLDDPAGDLQLRDIVVLCPDLENYRAVLSSTLGILPGADGSGAPRFPLSIARSTRTDEPLVEALLAVLRTARGRCTASAVGALATLAPVRRTFGFSDADLANISEWIDAANVRWGLDGDHLASDGIPSEVEVTTWEAALDRLLLGITMMPTPSRIAIGERRPCDAVGLDDAIGLGRLAELVHRLRAIRRLVSAPMPAAEWIIVLREVADAMLTSDPAQPWEARQLARLFEPIERDLVAAPGGGGRRPDAGRDAVGAPRRRPVPRPVGQLGQRGDHRVRTGRSPGRAARSRLHSRARRRRPAPIDITPGRPAGAYTMRRRPRSPDRAAGAAPRRAALGPSPSADHLLGQRRPYQPADAAGHPAGGTARRRRRLLHSSPTRAGGERRCGIAWLDRHVHGRHDIGVTGDPPSSPGVRRSQPPARPARRAGRVVVRSDGATTARRRGAAGARYPASSANCASRRRRRSNDRWPSPTSSPRSVNPVRTFLLHGVGVRIPRQPEERSDLVATKPDPLGAWGLASRLFELVLASELPIDDIEQQWRRLAAADGDLPPGRFAERAAASTRERIAALTDGLAASGLPLRAAGIETIDLRLPSGRTLTDKVTDVHGTTVVLSRPGRLRPKELLDAHVRVLALRATGIDADGIIAGTTTKQPYDSVRVDVDVDAATAMSALDELVELALLCRSVAMPIAVNVAAAWAAGAFKAVPDTAWKEDLWDPSTQLVFGHLIAPDLGLHIPPGEHRTGFELATRLWGLLRGVVS